MYIPEDKQQKKVKSRNKKSRKKFRAKVSDGFVDGDIIRRSTEILQQVKHMDKDKAITEMEKIDNEITKIMEDTEAELPDFLKHWWSNTPHNTFKVAEYWKAVISFEHNGVKDALVLAERRNEIDPDVDIYQGDR
eukprot:5141608-Ditylum_brightwellii.AAC.1